MSLLSRNRPAFTLIELLVVIAVIAVLAGILFPVFAQARDKARQASCASNLRQIGYAIDLYLTDNDGLYPIFWQRTDPDTPEKPEWRYHTWTDRLYPYHKNGIDFGTFTRAGKNTFSGVLHCPSDPRNAGPSYAINGWLVTGVDRSQVEQPAGTVLMAEKRGAIVMEHFLWYSNPWPSWGAPTGTPITDREDAINAVDAPPNESGDENENDDEFGLSETTGLQTRRHGGGSNWLFADGHVKWSKLDRIWGNATTTNQFWPTKK